VLVVSFPSVMPVDQGIYVGLQRLGWDLSLIVPNRWIDGDLPNRHAIRPLEGFEGLFATARVARPGNVQRHFYVTGIRRLIDRVRPDVAYVEAEYFGVPSLQWGFFLQRAGIPWGVQACEIQDRPLPWPAKVIRSWVLSRADFVTARSPAAADLVRRYRARGEVGILPHQLWMSFSPPPRRQTGKFTVGFVGRLVEEKGIADLVRAMARLDFAARLLVIGDGPLRGFLESADFGEAELDLRGSQPPEKLPDLYAEMDVLVLPSRTTPRSAEQFGKVLIEAMACGTPVIGSTCGQIPWVIESAGGGEVFSEGDVDELVGRIESFARDSTYRGRLGERGRESIDRIYRPEVNAKTLDRFLRRAASNDRGAEAAMEPAASPG
jgi:glycosyltransferase involved in cell wall biosynthesis